jgi:hypothetical protein
MSTTIQVDFSTILSLLAIMTSIIGIMRFRAERKKTSVEDGKNEATQILTMAQLRCDLDRVGDRITRNDRRIDDSAGHIIEIRSDLKWIREALEKIEARIIRDDGTP